MERNSQFVSFSTKVDTWLALVLVAALLVGSISTAAGMQAARTTAEAAAVLGMTLLAPLIVGVLSVPTRYELHREQLVIRSGILRYRYAYSDIRGVTPTHNPLSAPAWSLDRLRIDLPKRYALVSPADKSGFLLALSQRAPHLRFAGDRLIG